MTTSNGGKTVGEGPWFTSDTHFFHTNIIKYCLRPFKDVDEMHRTMISNWNRVVPPFGKIYHLGDFSFANKGKSQAILQKLNGYKILIRGNHDRSVEHMREVGFNEVYDAMCVKHLDLPRVYLHHQPEPDWAEKDGKGCDYHLCGHVHELWARQGKIINVGVDQSSFTPLTLPELLAR